MGLLIDLLPFIKGWKYDLREVPQKTIPTGGSEDVIFAEKELGWFLAASCTFAGPNIGAAGLALRIDDWVKTYTIAELDLIGYVERGLMWPYLTVYNPAETLASASIEFPYPIPYKSFCRISATAPTTNPIVIQGSIATVRVKDNMKDTFLDSFRDVLWGPGILKTLKNLEKAGGG